MRFRWIRALASLSLAWSTHALAKADKPLFEASTPIHIIIQAPLSTLIRDRHHQGPIAGSLTDPGGQNVPINLELRGITRRTSEICDFPPLRVEFNSPPASSLFAGQKKLKLITHCKNSPSFQQYVLLEYSAYKMYNLLTPRSFRVRLANIDYRDSDGHPIASRIGYFLEELSEVAHRNGMKAAHAPDRIPVEYLSPADAARYSLFEDMLANHDWSMRAGPPGKDCCHNADLIGVAAPGQIVPIPYDFDYSGFVDTPYATPPAELDISDVRSRLYRGYCVHNREAIGVAQQMRNERPAMLGVLGEVPGLEAGMRQKAIAFLEKFFAEIGNEAEFNSKVLGRCVR